MSLPSFIYGTAWKEDHTTELVLKAIRNGFRAIDTANQRRHYHEAAVGDALKQAFDNGLTRPSLFLQTKFTSIKGQDHRLPYDPDADSATQVRQSFQSSLTHLNIETLDTYILHGPSSGVGLTDHDWQVWQEMEALKQENIVTYLGISNVSCEQLSLLYNNSTIKPTFVQNRCFASTGWDKEVRLFCQTHGLHYQGFSLLTANPHVLSLLTDISKALKKTPAQVLFRFAQQIGMIPLTGTRSDHHMQADLHLDFDLDPPTMTAIETVSFDDT